MIFLLILALTNCHYCQLNGVILLSFLSCNYVCINSSQDCSNRSRCRVGTNMLHLVFSKQGLQHIKHLIKRRDQIVHISTDFIKLYNTNKLLKSIEAESNTNPSTTYSQALDEGTIIEASELASIVTNASSIKSTY